MLVLPSSTAPAALNRSTTCASYGATKFASIFDPQVVNQPCAQKMSLCARGIPVRGPASPRAMRWSAARACARLRSGSTVMNALRLPCAAAMRSRHARVSSTLETRFWARSAASALRLALSINPGKRLDHGGRAPSCSPYSSSQSLDNLGNEIEVGLNLRRDRLKQGVLVGLGDDIRAQA